LGPDVIDTRSLGNQGYFTYDPGFLSTASCSSSITYIDGDQGLLYYRGYPIEQLAERSDFLEVSYLLWHGELPNAEQKKDFDYLVSHHSMLHDQMLSLYKGFRRDAHPMAVMVSIIGAMAAFYPESSDVANAKQREISMFRLLAKVPTVAAWSTSTTRASRSFIRRTTWAMRRISCTCCMPTRARNTSPARYWRARWIAFSSCMPTTSRMPPPPPCAWPVPVSPIRSPASPPARRVFGGRCMAAPTKRC
jgi:citrate synthase